MQVTAYSTEPDPLFKEMLSGLPGKAASKVCGWVGGCWDRSMRGSGAGMYV